MTEVAKLAIVGAGVIGRRHVQAIAASNRVELAALVDVSDAARVPATQANVPLFANIDHLLDAAHVDGLIIATPTFDHHASAKAALERDIPVLIEKPVAATAEEAQDIARLSTVRSVPVLVGHQRRHYALVEAARNIIRDELGQLVLVNGIWAMRKHDAYYEPDWRKRWQAGPILTNLIHEIDLIRFLCGEITSINAETGHAVQGFEKEDAAVIAMRFASGALGTFALSDQAASPWAWELATGENAAFPHSGQNALRFAGTKASLDFPNLTLWHFGDAEPEWRNEARSTDRKVVVEDAYVKQIEHFADVIAGRTKPVVDAADAARSLEAVLAVYEAAETGRRVPLEDG